ncbi:MULTISPECIES: ATP-grasp domain-containing protein [unclassified Kitasatospora]|uniref:ATP-grasp domain-containing protein n=1 Tax=unclassified Kitasatospora TaxID=2633591 RepID=UPI0033FAFA94
MTTDTPVLLIAPRINETGLQLRTSAGRRGLRACVATSWQAPRELLGTRVHVYGGPLFGDAVGRELGLGLLEPAADWLTRLPLALTGRRVTSTTLAEARRLRRPAFVKPPVDKLFAARVYPDGSALPGPAVLDGDIPVLVSEVVRFGAEYRLFVLDGAVRAGSRYAVDGELSVAPLVAAGVPDGTSAGEAAEVPAGMSAEVPDGRSAEVLAFTRDVLAASAAEAPLPSAAVVDVGLTENGRWAVVEANAAWASGGYAADPDAILDVVLRSGGPAAQLPSTDRPFLRELPEVVR